MPVVIRNPNVRERIAVLCPDEWELPNQICELERWLDADVSNLTPGSYIADIGFHVRRDATGGGAALSPEAMQKMSSLGMSLFLSEYGHETVFDRLLGVFGKKV